MVRCFELAGDLTLLYLQEQDKLTSTPSVQSLPSITTSINTGLIFCVSLIWFLL